MKHLRYYSFILLAATLLGCKYKDVEPVSEAPDAYQPSAEIFRGLLNGSQWQGEGSALFASQNMLSLKGVNGSKTLSIAINNLPIRAGTYQFTQDSPNIDISYTDTSQICQYSEVSADDFQFEGTLKIVFIDEINKNISGRFRLTLNNERCEMLAFEQGVFELTYSE